MINKKITTTILGTSFLALTICPAFAEGYVPQYNSQNTYSSPGANYGLNNNYQQPTHNTYPANTYQTQTQGNYQQPYTAPANNSYQPAYQPSYQPPQMQQNYLPPLQGRVVTVPAGISVSAAPNRTISTEVVTVGDTVTLMMGTPFYYNGVMIAPANSMVNGNVIVAEKAGRAGKNGKLKIRFTNIVTPAGQRIPISGKILTDDGTGMLTGGTSKDRAVKAVKDTAIGTGMGALAGTIFGPLSGGKTGKGAAMGAAVGGGLGLGKAIINKGKEVLLDASTPVDIVLDQPVTVNPSNSY